MNEGPGEIVGELKKLIEILTSFDKLEDVAAKIVKITDAYQRVPSESREYWLNGVCVGLGRYLDESGTEWRGKSEILDQLNSLVISAAKNLRLITPVFPKRACGCHEDGACIIEPLGPHCVLTIPLKHLSGSLKLNPFEAACFTSIPIPAILPKGSKIQRIINSKENTNNAFWWKLDSHLPKNRKAWREDYAVLSKWNDNTFYVEHELKDDTAVWLGQAASQIVEWKGKYVCILKGGEAQILLDPIDLLLDIDELKNKLKQTRWP